MASVGGRGVEFELNLKSFDFAKIERGNSIKFKQHTFHMHIDCLLCAGHCTSTYGI